MSDITGKVIKVLEPQRFVSQKNGNEYVSTVFVVEIQGKYTKKIAFKVMGEDDFKNMGIVVGGTYSVSFDVESREWKERWFTECRAWKVVRIDNDSSSTTQSTQGTKEQTQQQQGNSSDDNLPF